MYNYSETEGGVVWQDYHNEPEPGSVVLGGMPKKVTSTKMIYEEPTPPETTVRPIRRSTRSRGIPVEAYLGPTWTTREGRTIPMTHLEDGHLLNILNLLCRDAENSADVVDRYTLDALIAEGFRRGTRLMTRAARRLEDELAKVVNDDPYWGGEDD
jgi:hypothetical protein